MQALTADVIRTVKSPHGPACTLAFLFLSFSRVQMSIYLFALRFSRRILQGGFFQVAANFKSSVSNSSIYTHWSLQGVAPPFALRTALIFHVMDSTLRFWSMLAHLLQMQLCDAWCHMMLRDPRCKSPFPPLPKAALLLRPFEYSEFIVVFKKPARDDFVQLPNTHRRLFVWSLAHIEPC